MGPLFLPQADGKRGLSFGIKILCALQHFLTWISACQRGYNICKHWMFIYWELSLEKQNQPFRPEISTLKLSSGKSHLCLDCWAHVWCPSRWLITLMVLSEELTSPDDRPGHAASTLPVEAQSMQVLHSQMLSLGCVHPILSSVWAVLLEKCSVLINQNMPAEFVPWFWGSEKNSKLIL